MNLLQRTGDRGQESGVRGRKALTRETQVATKPCDCGRTAVARPTGVCPQLRLSFAFFLGVALFALPLFAHGCHGDDVDHEPLLVPFRFNGDDR